MAQITVSTDEIAEMRGLVDERASVAILKDAVFTRGVTLGVATDWAWHQARQNRTDAVGTTDDFDTFLAGLSVIETTHFRRAVFFRTAGLVASRYRELVEEGGIGIDQTYGKAQESVPFLFAQAESELSLLRESAPSGAYGGKVSLTLFAVTSC